MADQTGNVVLPKELRLAPPATMPQSRSYMFKQQAALSNYGPRDVIQINIPRLQRSYLTKDSYLEFEVTFEWKPHDKSCALCLDTPGALGLIDRIEVYDYLGSTQLESTSGFGQLVALLQDTCITRDEYSTHWEITGGGQTCSIVDDWERWPDTEADKRHYRPVAPMTGEILDCGAWTPLGTSGARNLETLTYITRRYHIPLFSFLGLLSPKYAPLHNGYTIMITLQSAENALSSVGVSSASDVWSVHGGAQANNAVNFTVNQARLDCQILELGPVAESMLLASVGSQPMIVTSKAYRNYVSSLPENSATFRLDLNINVASLTNILWIMRPTTFLNSLKHNSLSHRQRNFLETWHFQYGSSVLPQTSGITCFKPHDNNVEHEDNGSEAFIELLKARHMYNQPSHRHVFNKFNYAYDNPERNAIILAARHNELGGKDVDVLFELALPFGYYEKGKFACGLDLELVSGRTNEIICGMNTNGMNTSIFGTFNTTAASAIDTAKGIRVEESRVDAWCEYDAFINISPGIATTVSF